MMGRQIPSFAQGYAHSAAESENPGLWRSSRGLWVPPLGPTGLKLWDVSGHKNDGVLTNMDPETDWVGSPYGWALDFDGDNDEIYCPVVNVPTNAATLACWAAGDLWDNAAVDQSLIQIGSTYTESCQLDINNGGFLRFYHGGTLQYDISGLVNGTWHFLVATFRDGLAKLYLDGREVASNNIGGSIDATANPVALYHEAGFDNFDGKSIFAGIWGRALAASEIQQLYVDPLAQLRLRRRVFPVVAAAPPAARPAYVIGGGIAA